ncbi:hypothetical protein PG993_005841 [Apiospora rasikravindrae]|uniref:Nephrocystin 3-like N-terminal domain-containing protein n=1 Tax=Apiospora rasikravindrae TaxID=990691 RepID=A0ABR1T9Y2_9PEZI
MAGLEPIAALSLACNVLQVVGIGRETVRIAKQVYQDGKLDPALTESAGVLNDLSGQIRSATTVASAAKPKARDKQLIDLADKCQGAARDLQEEVHFLNGPPTRAKLVATLQIVAKTTWRKRRLEKLDQRLKDAESLLQAGLFTRIYDHSLSTDSQLSSLNTEFRDFIYEYRQGHAKAADLTRKHVTRETKRSEEAVKSHVTETSSHAENSLKKHIDLTIRDVVKQEQDTRLQSKRDQLLRSLKFDRMNERRNQVSSSHPRTLSWLLRDGSESDADDDGHQSSIEDPKNEDHPESPKADISWDSFTDWLRSTETVYWISGKPGSGKSTVAKYLLGQPQTREYLNQWNQNPVLVSHFFWRPGTALQQSIKGLLCSLLYQLLSEDSTAADEVRMAYDDRSYKDNEADWAQEELQSALDYVMDRYSRPVVMFLDGLDEVLPKDGALPLLEVVNGLKERDGQIGKLKLCLGSRREPLFCKRLCAYPQLRLEQLNRGDLWRYGNDNMAIPSDYHISMPIDFRFYHQRVLFNHSRLPSRDELKDWLVDSLVDKAEGVFLWLCLTVREITKALNQDETIEFLSHRILSLPGDLVDLYADMWARVNNDSDHLKTRAASYLQLAMAAPWKYPFDNFLSSFSMMVATTPGMMELLLQPDRSDQISVASLTASCETTRRDAENRCAGLLEGPNLMQVELERGIRIRPWHSGEYSSVVPHVLGWSVYRFVHRTARDFLVDTEAGQKILSLGNFPGIRPELQLLKAHLAIWRLFTRPIWKRRKGRMGAVLHMNQVSEVFLEMAHLLSKCYTLNSKTKKDETIRKELFQLFILSEQLFNYGYLFSSPTIIPTSLPFEHDPITNKDHAFNETTVNCQHEFLKEAAIHSCFKPVLWKVLLPAINSRSLDDNTMSQLLVYACSFSGSSWRAPVEGIQTRLEVIHNLLDMSASPKCRRIRRIRCVMTLDSPIISINESPFGALMMSLWDIATHHTINDDLAKRLLDLIPLFVSRGADLKEEVYLVIEVEGGLIDSRHLWRELSDDSLTKLSKHSPLGTAHSPKGCLHLDLIMGCPASAMFGKILEIWKPKSHSQEGWRPELQPLATPGLGEGHMIAVVDKRQSENDNLQLRGRVPTLAMGDMFPVGHVVNLEQDLLPLVRFVEDALHDAILRVEHIPETDTSIFSHTIVPLETQAGLVRAVERLRHENVPVVERRREVRLRLGIETPVENAEWLDYTLNFGRREFID